MTTDLPTRTSIGSFAASARTPSSSYATSNRESYALRSVRSPSPPRSRPREPEPSLYASANYSYQPQQQPSYGRPTPFASSSSSYPAPSLTRKRSHDARRSPSPQPYKRHQPIGQSHGPSSSSQYSAPSLLPQQQPPYQQQQTRGYATQTSSSSMAPSRRSGGRSAPRSAAGPGRSAASLPTLPGPLLTAAEIEGQFHAQLKPQWRAEPKGPLSNYHLMTGQGQTGLGTNGDKFTFEEANVDGRRVFRCSVTADPGMNIVGTGDDANKREAEKLACLSAILQLAQRGLVRACNPAFTH